MYASTGASDADHTACSARPRPFCGRCTTRTPGEDQRGHGTNGRLRRCRGSVARLGRGSERDGDLGTAAARRSAARRGAPDTTRSVCALRHHELLDAGHGGADGGEGGCCCGHDAAERPGPELLDRRDARLRAAARPAAHPDGHAAVPGSARTAAQRCPVLPGRPRSGARFCAGRPSPCAVDRERAGADPTAQSARRPPTGGPQRALTATATPARGPTVTPPRQGHPAARRADG
jgi:hypothetical protein